MKHPRAGLTVAVSVICLTTLPAAQTPSAAAQEALAAARAALGGDAALSSIRTVRLRSESKGRSLRSGRSLTSTDELLILLPDHFLQIHTEVTLGLPPGRTGFAGSSTISEAPRWRSVEALGYLMLGLFLRTDTVFPFELQALSGDALRFADPNGVEVLIDLDPATARPVRLRYEALGRTNRGDLTGERIPTRIELTDHRQVGQLSLPHRLVQSRSDREHPVDEHIAVIEINPPVTREDFRQPTAIAPGAAREGPRRPGRTGGS